MQPLGQALAQRPQPLHRFSLMVTFTILLPLFFIFEKGFYYLFEELDQLSHVSHILIHCGTLNEKYFEKVVDSYLTNQLELLQNLPIDLSKGIMKEHSVLHKTKEN